MNYLSTDEDRKIASKSIEIVRNIVMNSNLEIIEIQGTAEKQSFSREKLNEMLDIGSQGIQKILALQEEF